MNLLNFSIIKIVFCHIVGIIIAYSFQFTKNISISLMAINFIVCGFLINFYSNKRHFKSIIGIVIFLSSISTGIFTYNFHNQTQFQNHYTKIKTIHPDSIISIEFRIREVLKPSKFHDKYIVDILQINSAHVTGKTLLNIDKYSTNIKLEVDDILRTRNALKSLTLPLNPHQFNYKDYLNKNHIYHQMFSQGNQLFLRKRKKHTVYGFAFSLRKLINKGLQKHSFGKDQLAIMNALLLGQRQDISEDIYNSFTQAGVIHILAVSGLHVGIILLLLQTMFKPLKRLKWGNYILMVLIVLLLWGYALVAGLSASVVRAVTMFTIVAIAIHLKRPTNIFNTLAISVLILLLLKPSFLFDVGFQLSYLAVLAIVIIQPILSSWWQPSNRILKYLWNIFTVTIAAQFGIIPIGIYYFNQFPGLFFISNLVIIPFLGFILGFGILIIVLSIFDLLPSYVADLYENVIRGMNTFISWISSKGDFLFQDISFNIFYVTISYALIGCFIWYYKLKSYKSIITALIAVGALQSYSIIIKTNGSQNKFIIFHKSSYTIIGEQHGNEITLYHNLKDISSEKIVTNYKVGENIKIIENDSINSLYRFEDKTLFIVDSLGVINIETIKPQIVLLRNSPKINLNRLIQKLKPQLIISDGSNFRSYQERWQQTCDEMNIPIHRTSERGAFVYPY